MDFRKVKELQHVYKEYDSLNSKYEKVNKKYQNTAIKAGCYRCPKRGKATELPMNKLHSNCGGCKYESSVIPLFKDLLVIFDEYNKFKINVASKEIYNYLYDLNPQIMLRRKNVFGEFRKLLPSFASLSDDDKLNLAYLLESNVGPIGIC